MILKKNEKRRRGERRKEEINRLFKKVYLEDDGEGKNN